jgi:hypothetical protein
MNQGTRWVLLLKKNRRRKSHAWAPLRVAAKQFPIVGERRGGQARAFVVFSLNAAGVSAVLLCDAMLS